MSIERKKYCVYGEWRESKTDTYMQVTDSSTGEVMAEVPRCTREEVEEAITSAQDASHVLAQAVKRLYPDTKLAIGPAIDDGFYYDFDREGGFTPEDLEKLEAEMTRIVKENLPVKPFVLPRAEAIKFMEEKGEPYKVELIEDLPEEETISFYQQGEFVDLCAGPHIMYTKGVKAFKLTSNN